MASNSFGKILKITTWGESHGKAIGVVVDGFPAGITITSKDINKALAERAPGRSFFTSPRREADLGEIYSGVFENKTTGAPISIIIKNCDADSSKYEEIKSLLRPGHANFTYMQKYGIYDYRGGGRASARETACRVAAGALAGKLLANYNIEVRAFISGIGKNTITHDNDALADSAIFCPDKNSETKILAALTIAINAGNSLGGEVAFKILNLPCGLGEPVYHKMEAALAYAMLSLPASKGFEVGEGFSATSMRGSEHNDSFNEEFKTTTNHAGGVLGGITTGMPLYGRVAFKPTSSIKIPQQTIDYQGLAKEFKLPPGSRHDPCVAIRAVPVVKAMCQLVIADFILLNKSAK